MPLPLPAPLEEILQKLDGQRSAVDEMDVYAQLNQAAPQPESLTKEERIACFAELSAWRFMRSLGEPHPEPWGIYWTPLASGVLADGQTPFYNPDVAQVSGEVLEHWQHRAATFKHPLLRSRYADLAWEIGRFRNAQSRKGAEAKEIIKVPVELATTAIDSYLDIVEQRLNEDEYAAWAFVDRALFLALSLNDKDRALRGKKVLFAIYQRYAATGQQFRWWQLHDLTIGRETDLQLDQPERELVRKSLEDALGRYSDISHKQVFDPHAATDAADRLARHFQNDRATAQRLAMTAGAAFEAAAKSASGMLAVSWLEDLIPRYRNAGLNEEAARIEREIVSRAGDAKSEMKEISTPVKIDKAELDAWALGVIGENADEVLGRIATSFLQRKKNVEQSLQEMAKNAPLWALMTATVMGTDGFTTAVINSVEDDLAGRALHHAADRFNWHAPYLHHVFELAKQKFGLDADAVCGWIEKSRFYPTSRGVLLREGIAAWLSGDAVKSIHVLIPQAEAAVRDVVFALGGSVRRPVPRSGGFEVLSLGKLLTHEVFVSKVPPDVQFHLQALLAERRGLNLRNHVAHGLGHGGYMSIGIANWIVQALCLIACLQIGPASASPAATSATS